MLNKRKGSFKVLIERNVPIWEKVNLTIEEAAEYSNIGICKINEMARNPRCPFVLYVGRKKLIKRKEFEKYLSACSAV